MDQTQRLIVAELEDRLEEVFASIEQLRDSTGEGLKSRRIVEGLFRHVHSFKASATTNNFTDTAELAHEFENLLHALRAGNCRIDDESLQVMNDTAEALASTLISGRFAKSQLDSELLDRLNRLATSNSGQKRMEVEFILNSLPQALIQSLNETERHRLRESVGEGAVPYLIETAFDSHDFDDQFQELQNLITAHGEVISTSPQLDTERPDKINFRILYTRDTDIEQLKRDLLSFSELTTITDLVPTKPPGEAATIPTAEAKASNRNQTLDTVDTGSKSIRVSLDDLDHVISLTHALVRSTKASLDHTHGPGSTVADSINNSLLQLAAKLVDLRMVSIDRILQRALRAGRSAAWSVGKDIDFVVRGRDLMIDKTLADSISDPLIHLVRNSVAHGIEDPERRTKMGKRRRATVLIEATTVQGQTRIAVSDDGRGIEPERVADAAVRLGIIKKGTILTVAQSVRMLFRSGFTTSRNVSGLSGRGVGLDAVESAIEEIGGAITVASDTGNGSRFEIRLPVTFGLLNVNEVSIGSRRYLIDTTYVSSILKVSSGSPQLQTENKIDVLHLGHLLGGTIEPTKDDPSTLLICDFHEISGTRRATERVGLLVDAVTENQQVLVRNLGSRGGRWYGVAGAAEMEDGSVVLLLDLARLVLRQLVPENGQVDNW